MTATRFVSDYFPLSIADGAAFCNRIEEIKQLSRQMEQLRPLLVMSPRRYGKTSLVLTVIQQLGYPFANIDFFSVVDEEDIEKVILEGIGKLIMSMESVPNKALLLAKQFFASTHINVFLNNIGLAFEISGRKEKPAYHILDILQCLEKLASKKDQKIILFFDEFQCLSEVTNNHAIESVLRQVAQSTKSIAFVFSGSNRQLLNQMFMDRKRPFYKLCERINLQRIDRQAYEKHLSKIAKKIWDKEIPVAVFDDLFECTKCHPYYVNLLCSRLFQGDPPNKDTVTALWKGYVLEERSSVAAEVELLSKNQKKLLTLFARGRLTNQPSGREFILHTGMSKATIAQALKFLENKDFVYKDAEGFVFVLDPLIKAVLAS